MKHLGDITKINGSEIEKVNCICFGSPCQDLSIAGFRKGLDGERSGLFVEAVRIIKEMRTDELGRLRSIGADVNIRLLHPRYAIWENVLGALSSNNGEDFRCVLEQLASVREPNIAIPKPTENGGAVDLSKGMIGQLLGELSIVGFGEMPNTQRRKDVGASHLCQILEEQVREEYSLSVKACQGILTRATKRNKKLPTALANALQEVIAKVIEK